METQSSEQASQRQSPAERMSIYDSEKIPTAASRSQPEGNQTKARKPSQPWLNSDGSSMNLDEIRRASEKWKPADWENYLASTEAYLREEYLKNGRAIEKVNQEDYTAALVETLHQEEYPALTKEVKRILASLIPRHRQIIHLRYWESKTLLEIAEIVGISRQGVEKALKASHKRIEERLRIVAAKKACIEAIDGVVSRG